MTPSHRGRTAKRFLDVSLSAIALLVLSIPMALIWAVVRVTMGPPVIFRQTRPGMAGELFTLYKFRTMDLESSARDHDRLTSTGAFLRRTSLDELPELVNVVAGDMSLVGPRPLLPQYLGRYSARQARRHEVRPGITGWAQVNGRNAITWEQKFDLDVWYVDNRSMALDLKILWMTLSQVLKGEGVSAEGHATMPEFTGSDSADEP